VDKITQQKIKEAKQLLEQYAPKGEFLAYINKKEARILKAYGGLGKPIKETSIPSFLAPWVLPAIMAIGTVVTFMGNLQNQKNIVAGTKANQNQIINKNNLNILNLAKKRRAVLKRFRALGGMSGTELGTGSNLIAATNFINETEEEIDLIERNTINELQMNNVRGAGLLAREVNAGTKTILGGVAGTYFAGRESGLFS
jgi:hypothetical protein